MADPPSTRAIYDEQADRWARSEKILLSDFTARPRVLEALGPLDGTHVLDLGCGEGYVSRLIASQGAASIFGIDLSEEMVRTAQSSIPQDTGCEMAFAAGDVSEPISLPRENFDRVVAVFLFNYLSRAQMIQVLGLARAHLAPGGRFVFTVPHPCFPYMRPATAPFMFDTDDHGYFDGADSTYEGRMWRRDGSDVSIRCVHKTVSDYFDALHTSGWRQLPRVAELHVTPEHLALDPDFFGPLEGAPLHMLFALEAEP
ncbi:class I SAM-dependent methyltransferase [Myxococcota bacterium]|nr:class I SAM-dependent methyltransferase [Myxococcota bacterium]